jgi:mannitol-1-/sugar-/sorbitol-6-phosphatase
VRTVLLDVDGTLIDSTEVHRRIWRSWSEHHGLDFDLVWAASHGRRPLETFADVAPHLNPQREYDRLRALLAAHEDGFPLDVRQPCVSACAERPETSEAEL